MLNVPQKFLNGFTGNTSSAYPIVIITAGDNIIRLSQIKGVFDGEYYEDRFLVVGSINEKIDIQNKRFSINQVRVKVSNYIINQIRFSEKFKNFSFTNAEVDIYYANTACKALDDCLFIFKGFVKDYQADKESVSFNIEDHSQYTLDKKTFPKYSTIDPASESVAESKDTYFPVVYGHVEKSPMIFSKSVNGTIFSQIYPDAIMFGVNIGGIANTENPLLMFRDDMYLPVPKDFRDLPDNFFINGFDYSKYNDTTQYTIEEGQRRFIQLEKKSTDVIGSSYLLPLNVAARDQFQVDASRPVTAITADTSSDVGNEEGYIPYGNSELRYLGAADGFDPYGENNNWLFPLPTGQLKLGYYQDFVIKGIVRKLLWKHGNPHDMNHRSFGSSSHSALSHYMLNSDATTNGMKGFDMVYLPMNEGSGQTELIQYFNEDFIEAADVVEINWKIAGGLESDPDWDADETNDYGISYTEDPTEPDGLWDGHNYAHWHNASDSSAPAGFPSDYHLWFGPRPGGNIDESRQEFRHYIWGVELINSEGEVVDYIGLDSTATGGFNIAQGASLTNIIKPEVYAWITELDDGAETDSLHAQLTPDTLVTLRKLLWGRKVTTAEGVYGASEAFFEEFGVRRPIPPGSSMYGLYPCLGYNVPKSHTHTYTFGDVWEYGNMTSGLEWKFRHYDIVVDNLFSYKNPYLLNQDDPIPDDATNESMLASLEAFDYSQLDPPANKNRLCLARHTSTKSYITNTDAAGKIAFYGYQPNEWGEDSWVLNGIWTNDAHHMYQALDIRSVGIEACAGGNWIPINNIAGKKDLVKLDLSFQSLSGDDIELGGVLSKIRGKVVVDAWKQPNDESFTGGKPSLIVECDALHHLDDRIIRVDHTHNDWTNGVHSMPDTETDDYGEPTEYYTFMTGMHEDENGNPVGYTNPDDSPPITFDSDFFDDGDPSYLNTVCDANRDDDPDQWKENINSVNTFSLLYHIDRPSGSQGSITSNTTLYFKTRIENLTLDQRFIIGNASKQKYFADVIGRIDDEDGRYTGQVAEPDNYELINKPSDILMHIIEKELGYTNIDAFDQDSVEEARASHIGWDFSFSVTEKTDAKEFIEDFAKSTKLIPRFRHNGTFGFINIFEYTQHPDAIIRASDVSKFKYSKTPIEDVKLMVRVKYTYDYGNDVYAAATNLTNDGAVPKNFEDMKEMYGINSLTDAYLEVESKYIRDELTAILLRNYLLESYKNQHNIIDCTLPPKYMYLECGDTVEFDSLIEEMTIFGEDYTSNYKIGGGSYAQRALSLFTVQEIKKSAKNVKVKLIHVHEHNIFNIEDSSPNYEGGGSYDPVGEIVEEEDQIEEELETIILGDYNLDGEVNVLDVVAIVNLILEDAAGNPGGDWGNWANLNLTAADINQDGSLDILDVVSIVQTILGNADITEVEV